jgi:hypothetical protein
MSRTIKALCDDGVVRTATITGDADSVWSAPARVSIRGRTITGHIFQDSAFATVRQDDGSYKSVDHPVTDATVYYTDAPTVVLGRMLFVARETLGWRIGQRVELAPWTDAWMRGDRYGDIVKVGRKYYSVRMDRSGIVRRVAPDALTVMTRSDGSPV